MADPQPESNPFDFIGGGKKRIPFRSFVAYFAGAAFVDFLLFWLPGAGTLYILWCRGWYFINSYKTSKMALATWGDAAIEIVPVLEALPGCMFFVGVTYAINLAETEALIQEAQKLAEAKTKPGNEAAKAAGSTAGKVAGEAVGGPVGAMVGSKLGGALAGQAANKAEGANQKSMDGVVKPGVKAANDNAKTKRVDKNVRGERGALPKKPKEDAAQKTIAPKNETDANTRKSNVAETNGVGKNKNPVQETPAGKAANDNPPVATPLGAETKPGYEPRRPLFHRQQNKSDAAESKTPSRKEAANDTNTSTTPDSRESERAANPRPDTRPAQRNPAETQGGRNRDSAPLQTQDYGAIAGRNTLSDTPLAPEEINQAKTLLTEQKLAPEEAREVERILNKASMTVEETTKIKLIVRRGVSNQVSAQINTAEKPSTEGSEFKKAA